MFQNSKDRMLLDAIRAEIRAGVEPLSKEIGSVKEAVERVERSQAGMYTREMVDEKLKQRDVLIAEVAAGLDAVKKAVGGFPRQVGLAVTAIAAFLLALIQLWPHLVHFFTNP